METNFTNQEILIFTNTSFSSGDWCKKEEKENQKKLSQKEKLTEACWNGMITELLPEICEQTFDKSISLWKINEGDSFLDLRFSKLPVMIEDECSLNPYVFMEYQEYN
ncbi:MAG: hypothetical protein ABJA78_03340 [Ferruginibacter sp.]